MNPLFGVFLHALGGFAAGSFYVPLKQVKGWSWESGWLVAGFFSWIVVPLVAALIIVSDLGAVLRAAPASSLGWAFVLGMLWGVGGLTFGLTMRYLGVSLGYAVALGMTTTFGTLIPPIYSGQFVELVTQNAGLVTLLGIGVTLLGIAATGRAGMLKDREQSEAQKREQIQEFNFAKGVWVALFSGVMSACMAFAIASGKPIAEAAVAHGTPALWQNTPVFVVILAGGFLTNALWCLFLNAKNRSFRDYANVRGGGIRNYGFAALAGTTWYLQFLFYGMGTTQMGRYDFASWSIHMAFIILFSTMWGLATHEWSGASSRARRALYFGLGLLVISVLVIGLGNYLAQPN